MLLLVHFWKIFLKFLLISKILRFFLMVLVIFGRNQLCVIARVILFDFSCVSFSVIRSILLSRLILSRCSLINDEWYPCFTKLFFISLRLLFELICLIRMLHCKVNYLSIIFGAQICCEGMLLISFFSVYLCP